MATLYHNPLGLSCHSPEDTAYNMASSIASRSVPEQLMPQHGLYSRQHSSYRKPKMVYILTAAQRASFEEQGYLVLRDVLSPFEISALKTWSQEVHDLPRTPDCPYLQYDEINAAGKQVLCRTENFCSSHPKFNALLRGRKLRSILKQLTGEEMSLFKEKSTLSLSPGVLRTVTFVVSIN
jgi:hypothetical protein